MLLVSYLVVLLRLSVKIKAWSRLSWFEPDVAGRQYCEKYLHCFFYAALGTGVIDAIIYAIYNLSSWTAPTIPTVTLFFPETTFCTVTDTPFADDYYHYQRMMILHRRIH